MKKIHISVKLKWLFTRIMQVIEIKQGDKIVVVIPLKGSIWKKEEIDLFLRTIEELKKEDAIKANFGSYKPPLSAKAAPTSPHAKQNH